MNAADFLGLLERRRSTRVYRDRPVPPEVVAGVVRAATLMPTSCNRQLWHFVAISDPETRARACAWSDAQQSYFYDAPVLLAVFYDTSLETRNPCRTAEVTVGIAIGALLLAAEAHGLGAIYLGGIRRPDGIRRAVGAPPWARCFGVVCLGYRDDDPPAPDRRPVADVLSADRFPPVRERYHADIRPHRWSLAQIADFRDRLLWYKGVHIDAGTLHVDADARASAKFQYMTGRLGVMIAARPRPAVLDVLAFNGDLVFQLLNACGPDLGALYAYDLTPGIGRYIAERFRRLLPPGTPMPEYLADPGGRDPAIPLPDGAIGVLSCYERLEHFQDPRPLLREMRRVLAPGGAALVVVSNRFYPHLYRYRRMRQKNYALGRNWNRGPERKYEPGEIEGLFRETGFRVTGAAGLQPVHLKASALAERLLRRLGLDGAADRAADGRARQYVTRSAWRRLSSSMAYELTRD